MTATLRKALYGLIPAIVTLLTVYGVLTDQLAVLWVNVATLAVGLGYAASKATGNRFGDPEVRRFLYVLTPALVGLVGGYISLDVALWSSLLLAFLGAALAGLNVDPDEQQTIGTPDAATPPPKAATNSKGKRAAQRVALTLAGVLAVSGFTIPTATPAHAAGFGMCSKWITTYKSFLGVEITRGHVVCVGNIPGGSQYRAKILCSKWAGPAQTKYGKWKNQWSGADSYNSCSWPWRIDDVNDILIQVK